MSETKKGSVMTIPAPPPDTPRPERILPTEPGWWYYKSPIGGDSIAVQVYRAGPPRRGKLLDAAEGTLMADEDEVTWGGYDWLCPIPTPDQLAAMEAQLAAGQALADHEREWNKVSWTMATDMESAELLCRLLAAFPPGNAGFPVGAFPLSELTGEVIDLSRPHPKAPPAEEPPSAEVLDLAAALRASLKGGAR